MIKSHELMPSYLDREISTPDRDAFGHRHFAQALRSLIESEAHSPPFSIGLLGGWGTGKSTIKELYIRELNEDQTKKDGHIRSDRIHSITFNAWRFGGGDIKRALLRHVFLELGGDEEALKDKLFRQVNQTHGQSKTIREYLIETFKIWTMPIVPFLISFVLLILVFAITASLLRIEHEGWLAAIATVLIASFTSLLKKVKFGPVSPFRPVTRIELPSTSAEQYEDLLVDQLAAYKSGNSQHRKGKHCERLVVFVDDLDRLSSEEMVQGLDAIRTFMEIPCEYLSKDLGLVFVISCDEGKIADALYQGRRRPDLPGSVSSRVDARRYLDRIFQFRLEIPPFPRSDMRQYALERLRELPGIERDLKARSVLLENLVDRMIHVEIQSPRNALQIVNAFAQAWWLAQKREIEELGTERPGGLHEGAVTEHPIALAVLCALKVNYPDFYHDLQVEPELIQRFSDVVIRHKPLREQPRSTQELLTSRYLHKQDDDSTGPADVKSEFRSLRQYLASLVGVRWPHSLQPLLLLSEDPITRKFGAKAQRIYGAFVSGDTQGVLEGLGRDADTSPLKLEEARLLYQMAEDLRRESETRRANAARVLAELVDRLPKENVQLLVGPLCRELGDSSDLRSQLGVSKIAQVLTIAEPADRASVASRLIGDILTLESDMSFRLETMEPPSLDEAVGIARETVALALSVRKTDSLNSASDDQLIEWLKVRNVRVGGKAYQIPFADFEYWMNEHEEHLLADLREDYTDLLASQLKEDDASGFTVSAAMGRAQKIFDMLSAAGEETRPTLWRQLTEFVGLQQQDAVRVAWHNMEAHKTSPDSSAISLFVAAFARRLEKGAQDEEGMLEQDLAARSLISMLQVRAADLHENAREALSSLVVSWGGDEKNAPLACDTFQELWRIDAEETQRIIDDWVPRLLKNLPKECIEFLARLFPSLTDSNQSSIADVLRTVISTDNIDEKGGDAYSVFLESTPTESWQLKPLKDHLDLVLPQIAARHNNPHGYLYRVFPPVSQVLRYASSAPLGQMLHGLFSNAKNQPAHYAWLHSWMAGCWPEASDALKPYDPDQVFTDAHQFAVGQPKSSSEELLSSMRDMLDRRLVSASKRNLLIEAVCATWRTEPKEAIESLRKGFADLNPDQAANLIDSLSWDQEEHAELLEEAWALVQERQDPKIRIETTERILAKGTSGPENEPDQGLRIWIDAQGRGRRDLLTDTIVQPDLNDAHRKRLWKQVVRIAGDLEVNSILKILPEVLALKSIDETASAIFTDADQITQILGSTDAKARLSQHLMQIFHQASSKTIKTGIVSWCKRLNGDASLSKLKAEDLSDDDMRILESQFSKSRELKKLAKAKGSAPEAA